MDFADRLKQLRDALNLSQEGLGEGIGVSRSVIKNLEYRLTEPKDLMVQQLCKTYGVRIQWLMSGEGEMFEEKGRTEQIVNTVGKWIADDEEFKLRIIGYLTDMSENEWELLLHMVEKLKNME